MHHTRTHYCHTIGTTIQQIRQRNRTQKATDIRAIYTYILRQNGYTLHQIAKEINRNHSTVYYLIGKTKNLLQANDKHITHLYNQTKHLITTKQNIKKNAPT